MQFFKDDVQEHTLQNAQTTEGVTRVPTVHKNLLFNFYLKKDA